MAQGAILSSKYVFKSAVLDRVTLMVCSLGVDLPGIITTPHRGFIPFKMKAVPLAWMQQGRQWMRKQTV